MGGSMESKEKALEIAQLLDNKKSWNIRILAVGEVSNLADYFVIGSAGSTVQARAICDEVEEKLTEKGITATHIEGYRNANWIVLDYDDVMLHIFTDETREFYDIERLWNDVNTVPFAESMD